MSSADNKQSTWVNKPENKNILDDAVQLQKDRRERKPFFYCRWITTRPYRVFFVTFALQVLPVFVTLILLGAKYDLFPINFEKLPMELFDIPYRIRDFTYRDRKLYDNKITRNLIDSGYPTYERGLSYSSSNVEMFFDADGDNILSKANLQRIQYIEEYVTAAEGYQSSYCQTANSSLTCKQPTSLIRYFDGTYSSLNPIFNDPTFSNIAGVIYEAYTNNDTKADFRYFLPNSYTITQTSAIFSLTRTLIPIGCSLSGSTKCKLMKDLSQEWLGKYMKPRLEYLMDEVEDFEIYFISTNLLFYDVIKQAMKDMLFAVGSMTFIFCFMTFHTRSLFISGLAVMSILTSFAGTNLIYRCIIDFQYIGFFHVLAIFIILGIGADDLFVFYDAWRLTAYSEYPSLAHRLTDAYSKSCKSMFITSVTTCVAFVASALSPLLATKSFGVFAAILVLYNYCSVVIFFPNVIIIYHLKFEKWKWPCCKWRKKKNNANADAQCEKGRNLSSKVVPGNEYIADSFETNGSQLSVKGDFVKPHSHLSPIKAKSLSNTLSNGSAAQNNSTFDDEKQSHTSINDKLSMPYIPSKKKKEKILVVFFRDRYFRFITCKWTRIALIPVFISVVGVFGYFASKLEPDNENLQLFKPNHYYSKATSAQEYKMLVSTDSSLVRIHGIWGLKPKDRDDCHFSSIDCKGNNVYDNTFDPNPVANQQAMMAFCDRLYNLTASEIQYYNIRTDATTGQAQVACFTKDLNTFLQSKSAAIGIGDLSLPWDYTKTINFMNALPAHYDTSSFTTSFTDYLSIPVGYWLYNEFNKTYTADFGHYDDLIGEYTDTSGYTQQLLSDSSIYYGTKFRYIAVEINTTINRKTTGYSVGIPLVESWEAFFNTEAAKMPTGLQNGFQLTYQTWHWFYVQKSLADNAVQGIIIGVTLAFPILTLTTMNVIIGFLATTSICCTTICVIGVIPIAGWKLGLLVSLNMCMLVGLAVDYVVHLAEGYHLSLHKDRLNRTRDMLEEMATSVFSGACTTLGASTFMFFAIIQFFFQFGVFLFCTIGFSLFFSLGLFTMLMGLIGPENNTGCLKTLYAKLRNKCSKKSDKPEKISDGELNTSPSMPSISTAGSQNKLIECQMPPHITKVNVNGFSGSL